MPRKKGKEVAKKTAQEGLVEWKKSDGKKLLKKELWDVSSRYHSMSIKDIHASDERFSAYPLKNFSANFKSLKKKIDLWYGGTHRGTGDRGFEELQSIMYCRSNTKYGEPVLDTNWLSASGGRPPVASLNEVKAIAENMEYRFGRIMSQDDVAKLLSDHHLKKIEDAGFISMDSPEFTSQTKRNYSALIASQGNVSISKTSTVKTTTRFAAENSIRACISNLALIGSTHFIPVQYEDSDIRAEIKALPESTKPLLDMVSMAWGASVFPVPPELIISTDDTTEYIFEGMVNEQPQFVLATKLAVSKRGTNSLYRVEDSKSMNGL